MARSKITNPSIQLQEDDGSVLWSLIQGEQKEYQITLNFLTNVQGYTFEAVVMEALNETGDDTTPTQIRPSGINTELNVRIPPIKGAWTLGGIYNQEDVVNYNNLYYKLANVTNYVSNIQPNLDSNWVLYVPNKVYIQFPENIIDQWLVQPTPELSVKGFFELSVTEPNTAFFRRTFKPLRGMIEVLFSPTYLVN
jgi:hypothetical protein